MPHVVTQSCCADATCVVACPVNCIHPSPGEPGFGITDMLFIDPATCVGCGACVTACPVGAIVPDTALTIAQQPFAEVNAEYYRMSPHSDRKPVALIPPQRRLRRPGPFRIAVVGAGPAGLYTADELLKHPEITGVDVYDRLLTPHGLVRHGVAPDHASTKGITRLFEDIENQPGFRYRLGVQVGVDVSLDDLRAHYDGVVHAVGASADRTLDIDGENLAGSLAATDVVGWYNGHPDRTALPISLHHERAVVIGNGNVALDVARMLTRDPGWLETNTDISPSALNLLRDSSIREVVVFGRRGPAQAAFTAPELIGLAALRDVDVVVDADEDALVGTDPCSVLLKDIADRPASDDSTRRRIVLRFAASPVEIIGADGRVTGVRMVRNQLVDRPDGSVAAVPTQSEFTVDAGVVIRSIGHRGLPVPGLPFDSSTGTVPHDRGRVDAGIYVAGWIKRGPTGFIGTNKTCAQETVDRILDDLDADTALSPRNHPDSIPVTEAVDVNGWRRLDAAEREQGRERGRTRFKITDPAEQRRVETVEPPLSTGAKRRWSRLK